MLTSIVIGSVLLSLSLVSPEAEASPGDLAAYRAAAARAGADAAANVRLALWCEAHGLDTERAAPGPGPGGRPGQRHGAGAGGPGGRPRPLAHPPRTSPPAARSDEALNAALAEYNARREALPRPETAGAHWALALWCEEKGLAPEAVAHFTAVTRLAPDRADAWQKLGCRRYRGRWMTEAQVRAEEAEDQARRDADRRWREPLQQWWRDYVALKDPQARSGFARGPRLEPGAPRRPDHPQPLRQGRRRAAARRSPPARPDRRARGVPGAGPARRRRPRRRGAQARPQAPSPAATPPTPSSGSSARCMTPSGSTSMATPGAVGVLEVEDEEAILRKTYQQRVVRSPTVPNVRGPGWYSSALPPSARRNGPTALQKLDHDVAAARKVNTRRETINERVGGVLAMVTGEDLGADPDTWRRWWSEEQGVPYYRTSTVRQAGHPAGQPDHGHRQPAATAVASPRGPWCGPCSAPGRSRSSRSATGC